MVVALIMCLVLFITRLPASPHFLVYQWPWFSLGNTPIMITLVLYNTSLTMSLMVVSV